MIKLSSTSFLSINVLVLLCPTDTIPTLLRLRIIYILQTKLLSSILSSLCRGNHCEYPQKTLGLGSLHCVPLYLRLWFPLLQDQSIPLLLIQISALASVGPLEFLRCQRVRNGGVQVQCLSSPTRDLFGPSSHHFHAANNNNNEQQPRPLLSTPLTVKA